jgi:hypothetical protein
MTNANVLEDMLEIDTVLFEAEVDISKPYHNHLKKLVFDAKKAKVQTLDMLADMHKRDIVFGIKGQQSYAHTMTGAAKVAEVLYLMGRSTQEIIRGVVAYFWHDAAKSVEKLVTDEFLMFDGHPLPSKLDKIRRKHAVWSAQMAKTRGIDKKYGISNIIKGTHYYDSSYGFKIRSIKDPTERRLAKVLAMVDWYNAATHHHTLGRPAVSIEEAAKLIKEQFRMWPTNKKVYQILFPEQEDSEQVDKERMHGLASVLTVSFIMDQP